MEKKWEMLKNDSDHPGKINTFNKEIMVDDTDELRCIFNSYDQTIPLSFCK
ncbi:hypothetical protein YC2023_058168 [Brassica napus]